MSHGGYFECGSNRDLIERKDWRTLANAMYLSKYYLRYGDNACNIWDADQGTSNRNVMYGLTPYLKTIRYYNNPSHTLATCDLSFEVKHAQIVDGDHVHPNWWNFETQTLESALLKQGGTYLLPLVSHKEIAGKEQVLGQAGRAGLEAGASDLRLGDAAADRLRVGLHEADAGLAGYRFQRIEGDFRRGYAGHRHAAETRTSSRWSRSRRCRRSCTR